MILTNHLAITIQIKPSENSLQVKNTNTVPVARLEAFRDQKLSRLKGF